MASSATPLASTAIDVEQGLDPKEQQEDAEDIPILYHIVYGFSLFMLSVGTWAFFFPFSNSHIVADLSGMGGLATGIFLMLNSDLMVTFLRLLKEMYRFRESNQKYRSNLVEQKKKVRKLKETQKALERLDRLAHGNMDTMQEEMMEMRTSSRDSTRRNLVGILSVIRPMKQGDIRAGKDLDTIITQFTDIYIRAIPDVETRFAEMKKGLNASPRWQKEQSLSIDRLKFVFSCTLFEDLKDVKAVVSSEVEAETIPTFAVQEEPSASQPRGHAAPETKASVGGTDDDWADALAFAGGGQEKTAAAGTDDDWADAAAFANQ